MPMMPLTPQEAGGLLKERREAKGLTQEQVVDGTTVPSGSYLSNLESGKVNPGRSKHFPSLAAFLGLSEEEIRAINPSAVITLTPEPPAPSPRPRSLPDELAEMIAAKGHLAPELKEERWQQYLAGQRFSTGSVSPERWWNLFLLLKSAGVEPGGN
ncbi:hypothetical protein RDMS_01810 [Deinococcus sp. RL]|nr:hypothetical protein RDMS_01810 [Deinococcus sp. RL]